MNVTNLQHAYWIEKRDIYTPGFRRRSGITNRIPPVMYKMVMKFSKSQKPYPHVQHKEKVRADSHFTSRFRSVAESHRSVKFSHV